MLETLSGCEPSAQYLRPGSGVNVVAYVVCVAMSGRIFHEFYRKENCGGHYHIHYCWLWSNWTKVVSVIIVGDIPFSERYAHMNIGLNEWR